ncbi:hypothetical protein Daus18300_001348 [Diaporthe australafricana]|uniref:Uncharacterized protein n=1 Tax=Diaporthe australafricana TaxID=127596 RepID=A0ABR3XXL9_9PEZI
MYFGPRDGFMASEANLRTVLSLCDPTELAQVRRAAINEALFWVYDSAWHPASLLVDMLRLIRTRLPGLRELVFVPRDENPLYSSDCYLTPPAMAQNRLARQVREAMRAAFERSDGGTPDNADRPPWEWKIMTLSADPDPPSYDRQVLGWCGGVVGAGPACGDQDGTRGGVVVGGKGHLSVATRLGAVQESARRFLEMDTDMEVDVCGQ